MTAPVWVRPCDRPRRVRGDPEVGDLDLAGRGDEHVARLDVAVHDPVAVGERERVGDLGGDPRGLDGGMRPSARMMSAQRPALDVLHDDEVRAVLLAPVVDTDDVGVVQRRRRSGPPGGTARRSSGRGRTPGTGPSPRPAGPGPDPARGTPRPCRHGRRPARSCSGSRNVPRPSAIVPKSGYQVGFGAAGVSHRDVAGHRETERGAQHAGGDRRGDRAAGCVVALAAAVLDEHRDRVLGRLGGRERDEPGVRCLTGRVLRGAGLARDGDARGSAPRCRCRSGRR